MKKKSVLTSGEIAQYCDVTLRTVIRWIEKGYLKAYKLPGRGNNRVQVEDFLAFLHQHGMPIPEPLQDVHSGQPPILIVDDDEQMAQSVARVVRKQGYDFKIAHDGFQAGIEMAACKPSLMILDLMMPKMNGFQVIRFIRESAFSSTKIVVLSGAGPKALNEALVAGADVALEKPFDNKQLIAVIDQLIGANG